MKLKRLISCGLVGILTGVGILMNAKVSSAEDKSVKFEFKSSTDSSTEITFDTFKKEVTSGNADLISNIKSTKVYAGKQGLKFGSSSKNGSLTFTLNQNYKINQFKVGIAKYNDKDGGKVKVQCGEYSEDFTPESSVLEFDGKSFTSYETNTFTISTTAKRAYVKSIEFLYNNAETCTVAYYDGADVISTFTVDKGTTLDETSKPANPEKEGYVFAGWYTNVDLTDKYNFDLPVTADLKLYAKFEESVAVETQTVTFMKDAETLFDTSVVKKGNTVGVPAEPTNDGYSFAGWYTDVKCTTAYDFNAEIQEDVVLVAKYEALTPAELFEQLEIKNQLAYHWQTEDGTTYTIDNVSLRFGVNLTEEMKSLEGVKFGAILAKKVDVANINLSEYARECTSAAEVVAGDPNLKYLEFTNIAAEGGMTSLRLDNLDSALAEEFVVVIYMEYNGKLYVTEQKIASVKVIASEYLKSDLEILKNEQIKGSLNQLSK